jgi:UDP-glucose 4-epimerase
MQSSARRRVIITGGAGFIGWRAATQLATAGHAVAIVDNLHVGMPMPNGPHYTTHVADIRDEAALLAIFADFKPDTVIHLAAIHHIPTCEQRRAFAQEVNIVGTETLLKVAEEAGVRRFVLASSGAVYDWVDGALDEVTTPLRACDNYALCKLTNEMQLRFWQERGTGREVRIARIFNTIGHDDPNAHLIPDVLDQLFKAQQTVTIKLGNLVPKRDYIHADDTAAGIVALTLASTQTPFVVTNIGTGTEASVEDLVRMIGAKMGVSIVIESDPARVRRVDRLRQLAKVERVFDLTGWRAKATLAQSIADIVDRYDFARAGRQDRS